MYLGDIIHYTIHDLPLERLEDDSSVPCDKLGLSTSRHNNTISNVRHRNDRDDVSELARTCAFDVRVQLRLQELQHPWPEIGRMKKNRVC